ncbi:MAG: FGGY family carbohydrate kinase [Elusimicrobiota bacterium]
MAHGKDKGYLKGEAKLPAVSAGFDIGSTLIKAGVIDKDGLFLHIKSVPSPPISGTGLIMEGDAQAYQESACSLFREVIAGLSPEICIGVASQRSSFILWEKETGKPVTPMVSWQDRRAARLCHDKAGEFSRLKEETGLLLSPHYAGPKLAHMFFEDKALKTRAEAGHLLFGTLETYLVWKLTGGLVHTTDISMASRTLLADPVKCRWSSVLLDFFGVPGKILPDIEPTYGRDIPIDTGRKITATAADQAASLIAVTGERDDIVSVNLGTGGFVVCPTGRDFRRIPGYLSGPYMGKKNGDILYSLEGTINGITAALSGLEDINVQFMKEDKNPVLFCMPDTAGIGAPYWRPAVPFTMSEPEEGLSLKDRKQAVLEGIIFRITGIINGICRDRKPSKIFLSGGVTAEKFIGAGLASCLGRTVSMIEERDTSLKGAAMLASGNLSGFPNTLIEIEPEEAGEYLADKYFMWKEWVEKKVI